MIDLRILDKDINVVVDIDCNEDCVIKSDTTLFRLKKSPYTVKIKVDGDGMACDLYYNLESYEVMELGKCQYDLTDGMTNIMVCDNESRLSILFIKDGIPCQFDGKIIKHSYENSQAL